MLDKEIQRGDLTRGTWAAKQWLGFVTVSRMVDNYISMGLEHGVRSWDEVVLRIFGVLLQTACVSRTGDIYFAPSDMYDGDEDLAWNDVEPTSIAACK
jgi:hypothetical protein